MHLRLRLLQDIRIVYCTLNNWYFIHWQRVNFHIFAIYIHLIWQYGHSCTCTTLLYLHMPDAVLFSMRCHILRYHSNLLLPQPPSHAAAPSGLVSPCGPTISICVAELSPSASDWACLTSHFSVPSTASMSSCGGRSNWISPVPPGSSRALKARIWYSASFKHSPSVRV